MNWAPPTVSGWIINHLHDGCYRRRNTLTMLTTFQFAILSQFIIFAVISLSCSIFFSASNNTKGLQFTLQGKDGHDLDLYFCQNHNYGNNGIHYYAVLDYIDQVSFATQPIKACKIINLDIRRSLDL